MKEIHRSAKPFVKWAGGKRQLLPSIERELPAYLLDYCEVTYIEPFVGGGAVLFWMLENIENIGNVVINDINPDLMKAYMTVKTDVENLCLLLLETERDYLSLKSEESRKSYFLDKREKYNEKSLSDVENTALFIFLNRICFNGLYRVNRKGDFNVSFGKYNNPTICDDKTLYIDSELLRRVKILTGDYAQTLRYAKENTLFYLDPPYKPLNRTSNFNSYTKENFNDVEQIRLKYFCDELESRGYYWMLSNSDVKSNNPDNNFFDDLYSNYQISRVWASRSVNADAGKRGKVAELLIKNYDQRDMFCKAINSTN